MKRENKIKLTRWIGWIEIIISLVLIALGVMINTRKFSFQAIVIAAIFLIVGLVFIIRPEFIVPDAQ